MNYKQSLFVILAASLLLRVAFISTNDTYAPSAYQTIQQVQHIKDTGLPLIKDTLQNRVLRPLPVFPYILGFSTIFLPEKIVYLLISNIIAVLLQFAVYLLAVELTNERRLALFAAAASIFIPSYLGATMLTLSPLSLGLPLFLLTITLYLKLRKSPEKRMLLLAVFILLCFTSPIAILFIPFLILNLSLSAIKRVKGETAQQEFGIFALFFLFWFNLLLYKPFIEAAGLAAIRVPGVNLLAMAAAIGLVPFSFALYAAYKEGLSEHIGILSALSAAIGVAILLAIGYVETNTGLSTLAALSVCLAVVAVQRLATYSRHLKRLAISYSVALVAGLLFIATSVLPTITVGLTAEQAAVPDELISVSEWLQENSPQHSLVLTKPEWGFAIETVGKRAVFIDQDTIDSPSYSGKESLVNRGLAGDPEMLTKAHIDYVLADNLVESPCLHIVQGTTIKLAKVVC